MLTAAVTYAFGVEISAPATIFVDDTINVTLKLKDITTPLAGVEYVLTFDNEFLEPVIKNNTNDEMKVFMAKTPSGIWEQMCRYDEASSSYYLRFVAEDGGTVDSNLIKTATDLVINIPFVVKNVGSFNLTVNNTDNYGIDKNLAFLPGLGSSISLTASNDLNRFSVDLALPENIYQGSKTNLTVTITNNKDNSGLIGTEFKLFYDNTVVSPVIKLNDNEQMNVFLTQTPDSAWEQMCFLDSTKSCYIIRLAAKNVGSVDKEILKVGNQITLTIPFTVTGENNASTTFSVTNESCLATNNIPKSVIGLGSSVSAIILTGEKITLDTNSSLSLSALGEKTLLGGVKENTSISVITSQFLNTGLIIKGFNGNEVTSGVCKTGDVLCLYDGNILIDSVTVIIKGDLNRDGKVSSVDYLYVKRAFLGTISLDDLQLQAAYVAGQPKLTAAAYLIIKRHVLGTYNIYS